MERARLNFWADLTILEVLLWYLHLHRVRRASILPWFLINEHRFSPPSEPVHHGASALVLAWFWVYQATRIPFFFSFFIGLSLHSCDTRLWAHGTYLFSGPVFVNNQLFSIYLSVFSLVSIVFLLCRCMGQPARHVGYSQLLFFNSHSQGSKYIYCNCITCYKLKQPGSRLKIPSLSAGVVVVNVNADY